MENNPDDVSDSTTTAGDNQETENQENIQTTRRRHYLDVILSYPEVQGLLLMICIIFNIICIMFSYNGNEDPDVRRENMRRVTAAWRELTPCGRLAARNGRRMERWRAEDALRHPSDLREEERRGSEARARALPDPPTTMLLPSAVRHEPFHLENENSSSTGFQRAITIVQPRESEALPDTTNPMLLPSAVRRESFHLENENSSSTEFQSPIIIVQPRASEALPDTPNPMLLPSAVRHEPLHLENENSSSTGFQRPITNVQPRDLEARTQTFPNPLNPMLLSSAVRQESFHLENENSSSKGFQRYITIVQSRDSEARAQILPDPPNPMLLPSVPQESFRLENENSSSTGFQRAITIIQPNIITTVGRFSIRDSPCVHSASTGNVNETPKPIKKKPGNSDFKRRSCMKVNFTHKTSSTSVPKHKGEGEDVKMVHFSDDSENSKSEPTQLTPRRDTFEVDDAKEGIVQAFAKMTLNDKAATEEGEEQEGKTHQDNTKERELMV